MKTNPIYMMLAGFFCLCQIAMATDSEKKVIYAIETTEFQELRAKVINDQIMCILRTNDYTRASGNVLEGLFDWSVGKRAVTIVNDQQQIEVYTLYNNAVEIYQASGLASVQHCEGYKHKPIRLWD